MDNKDPGGLAVGSLFSLIRALCFKWQWRFHDEPDSLWVQVINVVHDGDSRLLSRMQGNSIRICISCAINHLASRRVYLKNSCTIKMGNGHNIRFQFDKQKGDQPLKNRFYRVFSFDPNLHAIILDPNFIDTLQLLYLLRP